MRNERAISNIGLLGDFRLLLILFISFRLMMMIVYQPLLLDDGQERGIGVGGDRQYHYALTELTSEGLWPFVDWWSEFPPVWYFLTTAVYQYQGENAYYGGWSILIGMILLIFEMGNLMLIRLIGKHLYGELTGQTLAWAYSLMLAPMVFLWWNFEVIVAFFLLLGLWFMIKQQHNATALAIAAGTLTKFTPALLFGALIRFRPEGIAYRVVMISLAVFAGVYALLYLNVAANDADPDMVTVSLTAQFGKASYQTVWALLDDNYTTGNFGLLESHFDPDAANTLYGNPAVIPSFVRLGAAAAIGLFVYLRTRRLDDRGMVAFVSITVLIFFLQAQGWSPQWLSQIIPLVLLSFPTKNGILVCIVLSFITFTEYPLLFIRTGDTDGVITGALQAPFMAMVISRTLLLIALCFGLYDKLRQDIVG